jgi:hypothetical protein
MAIYADFGRKSGLENSHSRVADSEEVNANSSIAMEPFLSGEMEWNNNI